MENHSEPQGVIAIFSCNPSETSSEIENLQHGVFTYALLEAFRLKGDRNCATVERLDQYLRRRVPELSRQFNEPQQRPYIVAEPISKASLVLLPQRITPEDIAALKRNAESVVEKYQQQLEAKEREIEIHRQQNTNLMELAKLMASRPINVEATAKLENQIMTGDRNINTGGGNYIESNTGTYIQGDFVNMSQDLAQAAAQIQSLLEQLQNRGVSVGEAQVNVAEEMANQAKQNPTMKEKLLKWGQSLGDATVSDVVKGAVKLAIRSAGVPLP